jgi:hypothetical protein
MGIVLQHVLKLDSNVLLERRDEVHGGNKRSVKSLVAYTSPEKAANKRQTIDKNKQKTNNWVASANEFGITATTRATKYEALLSTAAIFSSNYICYRVFGKRRSGIIDGSDESAVRSFSLLFLNDSSAVCHSQPLYPAGRDVDPQTTCRDSRRVS